MSGGAGKKHGFEGQGQGVLKVQQHQRLAHLPHPLHIHHLECIVQEGHAVKKMFISFQKSSFSVSSTIHKHNYFKEKTFQGLNRTKLIADKHFCGIYKYVKLKVWIWTIHTKHASLL